MSTLRRDFRAESGDPAKWDRDHLTFWIANHYRGGDPDQARADIERALEADPEMVEWASWPMVLARGEWMRKREGRAAA